MKFDVIEIRRSIASEPGDDTADVLLVDEHEVIALVKRPECVSLFAHAAGMLELIRQVAMNQCGHRAVDGGYDDECLICEARRMVADIEGVHSLHLH